MISKNRVTFGGPVTLSFLLRAMERWRCPARNGMLGTAGCGKQQSPCEDEVNVAGVPCPHGALQAVCGGW